MTDVMYERKTMPESISAKIGAAWSGLVLKLRNNIRLHIACLRADNFEWTLKPGQSSRTAFLSVRNDNRK